MIPRKLIEQINLHKYNREKYINELHENEENLKQSKKLNKKIIKSDTFFTSEELSNMANTFFTSEELSTMANTLVEDGLTKPKQSQFHSPFYISPYPHMFDNFNGDKHEICNPYRKKNRKLIKSINQLFMDCVNIITSMNIKINSVCKQLENYQPGKKDDYRKVLTFYCIKGNYTIKFIYYNYPGYLLVKNIIKNNVKIDHHVTFNLDGIDKYDYDQQKFIAIINDNQNFTNEFYGHIIRLPQLLSKSKYTVYTSEMPEKYFDDLNLTGYYIKVKSDKACVILTPSGVDTIHLSNNVIGKKMYWQVKNYRFTYKSDTDIDDLIQCIEDYMYRLNNQYGYKENQMYYNETHLTFSAYIANDVYNLKGFDTYFILYGNYDPYVTKNESHIMDSYGIRFYYDQRVDPLNCILSIRPMHNKTEWTPFYELITIHESYSNCINLIENLITLLK